MNAIKLFRAFPLAIVLAVLAIPAIAFAQQNTKLQSVTLLKRTIVNGLDNYTQAAFSFKHGVNGDTGVKLTKNNWDVLFGNSPLPDAFDVSMVVDDCSRIRDLGALDWSNHPDVQVLPAYDKPTREPSVKAIVGHMYLVHTKDRDEDHYALFRVDKLDPGKSVTISWKLIPAPQEKPTS